MTRRTMYYTLIGSLPTLPRHFEAVARLPISAVQLDKRLKMLEPHDAAVLEELRAFLSWERQPMERTDAEVVSHYGQFLERVDNEFVRELIGYTMAARTILAGLRCRRLRREPPTGVPPVAEHIARHWTHPDFRLGRHFPWIARIDAELNDKTPSAAERTRLEIAWQHRRKLAERYQFTFEAVVLFVLGWEVLYRWTRRDVAAGQQKFHQLVSEAMSRFGDMFADESPPS